MFCSQCGKERADSDKFCANCGTSFSKRKDNPVPKVDELSDNKGEAPKEVVPETTATTYKSIIDGRMSRKEFAVITVAPYLLAIVFLLVTGMTAIPIIVAWFFFGYFAAIRRLHDMNKSAWWLLLIAFAMLILAIKESLELVGVDTMAFDVTILGMLLNISALAGMILLLALLFASGTKEDNKYGSSPKGRKLTWKGVLLNLHSSNEKLEPTYFYTTAAIFVGIIIVLTAMFLK